MFYHLFEFFFVLPHKHKEQNTRWYTWNGLISVIVRLLSGRKSRRSVLRQTNRRRRRVIGDTLKSAVIMIIRRSCRLLGDTSALASAFFAHLWSTSIFKVVIGWFCRLRYFFGTISPMSYQPNLRRLRIETRQTTILMGGKSVVNCNFMSKFLILVHAKSLLLVRSLMWSKLHGGSIRSIRCSS